MMKKIKNHIVAHGIWYELLLSLLLTIGVLHILGETMTNKYLLFALLYVAVFAIVRYGARKYDRRRMLFSLIYCIPFGIMFSLGRNIVYDSVDLVGFTVFDVLSCVALIVLFVLMNIGVFGFVDKKYGILSGKNNFLKNKRMKWLLYAVVLFLCWLPMFLIFFPGQVSVDSAVMISQIIGETELSNWHPVFYVFLISIPIKIGFYIFGNLTFGIALAVVAQMVLLSLIFGYISCWCANRAGKKIVGILFVIFFAFCPIISCYSITLWKDVLFSPIFLLLIIKLCDFVHNHGKCDRISTKDLFLIVVLVVLVAFLRNGGWLIVIALGVAMFIRYRTSRKLIGVVFSVVIALTVMVQTIGYESIGIAKSPFMESMSVPAQQMAYIANAGELTEDEWNGLVGMLDTQPAELRYSPMNADFAKTSFDYDYVEENKNIFLENWLKIMKSHFVGYIKAYLLQMYSYWYVQGYSWSLSYEHNHDDVWLKEDYDDIPLLGYDLRNNVEKLGNNLMRTSWFGWVGNVGIVFWMLMFVTMVFIYQRRYELMVLMVCPLTYMVSLLIACPIAASFRYVYSLMLMLPVLFMLCFLKEKRSLK